MDTTTAIRSEAMGTSEGRVVRRMLGAQVDVDGREWPRGTEFIRLMAGTHKPGALFEMARMLPGMESVTFTRPVR